MASGMEWALRAVVQSLGLTGEIVQQKLAETAQIAVNLQAQLNRIEANQRRILVLMGDPQTGNGDGQAIGHGEQARTLGG